MLKIFDKLMEVPFTLGDLKVGQMAEYDGDLLIRISKDNFFGFKIKSNSI